MMMYLLSGAQTDDRPAVPHPAGRELGGIGDLLACDCGSTWFELYDVDEAGRREPGAVVIDQEGRITGYYGLPYCRECGKQKIP